MAPEVEEEDDGGDAVEEDDGGGDGDPFSLVPGFVGARREMVGVLEVGGGEVV